VLVGTAGGLLALPGGAAPLEGDVTALAPGPDGWWALVGRRELWREGGAGWRRVAELPGPPGNCLLADAQGVWVGTAEAHLVRVTGRGAQPVGSFEAVPGRGDWYTPWGGPPDVRSLAAAPDGVLYANVHVGGIPRSSDGGGTWEPTIEIDADVHQVLASPLPAGRVLAATARGLAASEDGGASWRFEAEGLHAVYCRAVAVVGGTVLLTVSRGPRGGEAALYRRPLDGGPFERCHEGLPGWFAGNLDTHRLHAAGGLAALGTPDGRVLISEDEGASWRELAAGLPPVRWVAVDA